MWRLAWLPPVTVRQQQQRAVGAANRCAVHELAPRQHELGSSVHCPSLQPRVLADRNVSSHKSLPQRGFRTSLAAQQVRRNAYDPLSKCLSRDIRSDSSHDPWHVRRELPTPFAQFRQPLPLRHGRLQLATSHIVPLPRTLRSTAFVLSVEWLQGPEQVREAMPAPAAMTPHLTRWHL